MSQRTQIIGILKMMQEKLPPDGLGEGFNEGYEAAIDDASKLLNLMLPEDDSHFEFDQFGNKVKYV